MKATSPGLFRDRIAHVCALISALSTFGAFALGQDFGIDWFTMDGGGGTISGGPYILTGTLSQPDVVSMTGAGYSLVGGFWGSQLTSTTSPPLDIVCLNDIVTISWPRAAAGFTLERASTLTGSPIPWSAATYPLQTNDTCIQVTIPAPANAEFYRLHKVQP